MSLSLSTCGICTIWACAHHVLGCHLSGRVSNEDDTADNTEVVWLLLVGWVQVTNKGGSETKSMAVAPVDFRAHCEVNLARVVLHEQVGGHRVQLQEVTREVWL